MKGLLKNLGNNNAVLGGSIVLVVLGLITYIAINKRIAD